MSEIQVLLDSQKGPLPLNGQFQALADTVPSLFLSGSAQAAAAASGCLVEMRIYDQNKQSAGFTTAVAFSNEARQHKTLLALPVNQKPFAFGSTYTYEITAGPATVTDANDVFSVTILY